MFNGKSIRFKLSVAIMLAFVVIAVINVALSNTLLERYYSNSKQKSLISAFDSINEIYVDGLEKNDIEDIESAEDFREHLLQGFSTDYTVSEELYNQLERISQNNNLSVIIYRDMESSVLDYLNISDNTKLMLYSSFGMNPNSKVESSNLYSDYINARDEENSILENTDAFVIRQMNVRRLGSSYIYLDGNLENGDHILIRLSVAGIEESVSFSNRFFLYVTLFVACVGFIIMYIVTGAFVKPVKELNNQAKRMSELDFTAKYNVRTNDEFGMLGNSINVLSEKLEKSLDELKQANEELKQDLKQREAMDEMRKEFLSNVSHELKTPIALIQGYAEGLIDNINDDEESRQFYCEVIMDEAKKMNGMVKQIMALNQLEFGYSHVSLEEFDIIDLIHGVLAKSDILIRQKEANVCFEAAGPVNVSSDAFMAEEVFTNYFTNALNHVDGERRIDISLEKHKGNVRVNVFNTGDPIPEEDIGNIWDKFYKVDKARTREYGGSGVGLSIVKATMQLLGKDYGVENKDDGVLFWFEMDEAPEDGEA